MIKVFFLSPSLFGRIVRDYCVVRFLLGHKRTLCVNFNGVVLYGPNEHGFFYTSIEVFYRKLYAKLIGCTHILDLGGYFGESAVWLSMNNNKVTVVEPNPSNFHYLHMNTDTYKNIKSINGAISYKNDGQLYHAGGNFSAGGYITTAKTAVPVENIPIVDIWDDDIDGVKVDIEGAEYDIIQFLQTDKALQLKKGYIEFHNIKNNKDSIMQYLAYLSGHTYHIEYESIYGAAISQDIFFGQNVGVIYFYK